MKHRKIISVISAAALLCCSAGGLPFGRAGLLDAAFTVAADNIIMGGSCGNNATYTLYDTGKLVIEGSGELYEGAFDNWYFAKSADIKSVTVSSGITYLGDRCFQDCSNLKSITFEAGSQLTLISERAFCGCTSLSSFTIPRDMTNIDSENFYDSPISDIYCYADPNDLTWEADQYRLKPGKATKIHVAKNTYDDFVSKYSGTDPYMNGTFVKGDFEIDRFIFHPAALQNCTEDGNSADYYHCTNDGKDYRSKSRNADDLVDISETVIPADGVSHVWGKWTEGTDGKLTRTCVKCGENQTTSSAITEPSYIVTIPSAVDIGADGMATAYMDIRYYNVTTETCGYYDETIGDFRYPEFANKQISVKLDEINGKKVIAVSEDNPKYTLSDDHLPDPVEYSLSVDNWYGDAFDPLNDPDSYLLRAYLDAGSNFTCDDSAFLSFRIADPQSVPSGNYTGTLTFSISVGALDPDLPAWDFEAWPEDHRTNIPNPADDP